MPDVTTCPVRQIIVEVDDATSVEDAEHVASQLHLDLSWQLKMMSPYIAVRRRGEDFPIKSTGRERQWQPMPRLATT